MMVLFVGFAVGVVGETKWSVMVVGWCSNPVVGVESVAVVDAVDEIVSIVVLEG